MGRLHNFDRIKWMPYGERKGDISVTNFYMDNGVPKPVQSHLKISPFSYFEILKWQPNHYYGKLDEYLEEGYTIESGFVSNGGVNIDIKFFDKPETCYMLASWNNIDHDEMSPDLEFVGNRVFELTAEEKLVFMELAERGQNYIQKTLNDFYYAQEEETY